MCLFAPCAICARNFEESPRGDSDSGHRPIVYYSIAANSSCRETVAKLVAESLMA